MTVPVARLDGAHPVAGEANHPPRAGERTCLECGAAYAPRQPHGEFCSDPCRQAWNNRRMIRGAELYDLFMALRFDRSVATAFKVWRLLNRMASIFRDADRRERAGRPSWRSPREVLLRRPYLLAERFTPVRRRQDG